MLELKWANLSAFAKKILLAFCMIVASGSKSFAWEYPADHVYTANPNFAFCTQPVLPPDILIQACAVYLKMSANDAFVSIDYPRAIFFTGTAFARKNDNAAATKYFSLALQVLKPLLKEHANDQYTVQLLDNSCWIKAVSSIELDTALADCDRALALKPNTPDYLDARAFVLFRQGKYKEALGAYDIAISAKDDNASALFMRGVVKFQLGQDSEGDADIANARRIDSKIDILYAGYGIKLR